MKLELPNRYSLFWRLSVLLVGFCLLMIGLSWSWGRYMDQQTGFLSAESRAVLESYADDAQHAWERGGAEGIDRWLARMAQQEKGYIGVVDSRMESLGSVPLTDSQVLRMTALRGLDWPVSSHAKRAPWILVPFPDDSSEGSLVIELPERLMPGKRLLWRIMTLGVIPGFFTLAFCVVLYRLLVLPLVQLREQANAWRADQLGTRLPAPITRRRDELGELARAFDQMSERLQGTVRLQQQLLRDLSHEMRTPLSRLRVASESADDLIALRQRLGREVDGMQRLVEDALHLAWLDSDHARQSLEPIQVQALWDMLVENACFETGWSPEQLICTVPERCWVMANLNGLAQALENILRNAIRHSPAGGCVRLDGIEEGERWHLWLEDQGGGVAADDLERIFAPFSRLDGARPGDGGFGLGLSIARNALRQQGGQLWAENGRKGLRLHLLLARSAGISAEAEPA